jgi:hypothetical protein
MLVDLKSGVQIGRQVPIDVRRGTSVRRFLGAAGKAANLGG